MTKQSKLLLKIVIIFKKIIFRKIKTSWRYDCSPNHLCPKTKNRYLLKKTKTNQS